jgi:hypothetical protein
MSIKWVEGLGSDDEQYLPREEVVVYRAGDSGVRQDRLDLSLTTRNLLNEPYIILIALFEF